MNPAAKIFGAAACAVLVACGGTSTRDAAFRAVAKDAIDDFRRRNPSAATDLGVHTYNAQLDDLSRTAIADESKAFAGFRARADAIDPSTLSLEAQLDREQLIHALDAGILANDAIRQWVTNPDLYSGTITNAAYVLMKRPFAPAADRLKALIEREKGMPSVLDDARKNLSNPPAIYTQIALEQIDGNVSFFKNDVPAAFDEVKDPELRAAFTKSNDAVIAALGDYKMYLQSTVMPASKGNYAFGADLYRKALAANEMIELPLDRLLDIAERDRQKNEAAFQET